MFCLCATFGQCFRSIWLQNGSISHWKLNSNPARSNPRSKPPIPEKNEATVGCCLASGCFLRRGGFISSSYLGMDDLLSVEIVHEQTDVSERVDTHDPATRSYNMSRIRSRDTVPELELRRALWSRGLRGYRLHVRMKGRPDIVFTRRKVAVFVDGCFWHGCRRCRRSAPSTNSEYWLQKIKRNRNRDVSTTRRLRRAGWVVLRFWEHEIERDVLSCAVKVHRRIEETASR